MQQEQINEISEYDPLNDQEYMSENMLNFFKNQLEQKHKELIEKEINITESLREPIREPDHVDQGQTEELRYNDYMFQEHEDNLRHKIEEALARIKNGTCGYCEETGEPIGVKRLMAAPQAKYTLDIQEKKENVMKKNRVI